MKRINVYDDTAEAIEKVCEEYAVSGAELIEAFIYAVEVGWISVDELL